MGLICSFISLGQRVIVLGDWLSRLGGHPSPKRELESLGACLHVPLRRETLVCLGESLSRLGESSSPKRVIEVWLVGCETRRLGEGICKAWSIRLLRYLNGGIAGVPRVVARNVSLGYGLG
ncbi:hypothetical protein DEO72_LG4g13 [Vigna unguiculata]|uniref:Uncharacterized protein n=1 Tax=Vigna unguiculata TaxID=3917 RepID=A0A4D6LL75_VIGUN|nr:hypothetical protein DEO72_LG4g13 [Vigna unguiculata]